MNELKMLEILEQIEVCLKYNAETIAMDFIELQIDNLKGNTEKKCKDTSYYFYDYCTNCSNFNCNENKKYIKEEV